MSHRPDPGGSDPENAWFEVEPMPGCMVVTAAGEIDLRTAPGLDGAIRESLQSAPCVIVDMTRVTFVDSMALGVLIGARRRANEHGGSVLLVRPPSLLRKILVTTQLQDYFAVYETLDDAVNTLRDP